MNTSPTQPPSLVFLVRLWIELQANGQPVWRGKVQYLTSGEAHRFDDWTGLVAMLQVMLPEVQQDDGRKLADDP